MFLQHNVYRQKKPKRYYRLDPISAGKYRLANYWSSSHRVCTIPQNSLILINNANILKKFHKIYHIYLTDAKVFKLLKSVFHLVANFFVISFFIHTDSIRALLAQSNL